MRLQDLEVQDLLTGLLVGEAADQDYIGKVAIACVVRNRVWDQHRWPKIWHDVILQYKQFSCLNDISREKDIPTDDWLRLFNHMWEEIWWREAWAASWVVLKNYINDITKGSNHYHAAPRKWVSRTGNLHEFKIPYWAEGQVPIFKWGDHWFYRL